VVPEKQGLKLKRDFRARSYRQSLSSGSRKTRIETPSARQKSEKKQEFK